MPGFEITPVLTDRAPRSVYVLGEVQKPGKFTLDAPTTVIQAIALAGSWNIGANLKQVIVFRRDDEWRLMATRVERPAGALQFTVPASRRHLAAGFGHRDRAEVPIAGDGRLHPAPLYQGHLRSGAVHDVVRHLQGPLLVAATPI